MFLQLAVYARRAGHLSPGVEEDAYVRFVAEFTPAFGFVVAGVVYPR
jgi:hypothetical protein